MFSVLVSILTHAYTDNEYMFMYSGVRSKRVDQR